LIEGREPRIEDARFVNPVRIGATRARRYGIPFDLRKRKF